MCVYAEAIMAHCVFICCPCPCPRSVQPAVRPAHSRVHTDALGRDELGEVSDVEVLGCELDRREECVRHADRGVAVVAQVVRPALVVHQQVPVWPNNTRVKCEHR